MLIFMEDVTCRSSPCDFDARCMKISKNTSDASCPSKDFTFLFVYRGSFPACHGKINRHFSLQQANAEHTGRTDCVVTQGNIIDSALKDATSEEPSWVACTDRSLLDLERGGASAWFC